MEGTFKRIPFQLNYHYKAKMNSKKTLVAFASIVFALVAAGPVAAVCDINNPSTCTNADLIALLSSLQTTTGTQTATNVTACQGVTFSRNLSLGSTGADVKCLQALLNQAADTQVAATGVGSAGFESTYFGVKTQTAVKAFQTKYGIAPVAGFVGSITRAKLNTLLAGTGTATTYPAGCTSAVGYSPTTGLSCAGTATYPAGCTSATGYSPTTGLSCAGTGTGTTVTPGAPLTVALASDNPVGGNLLQKEANKTVTKITFTAAADADATINSLKVKSFGTANGYTTDVAALGVKVYDGVNQVGTSQSLVAGTATFSFVPAITITKGTAKTLSIVVTGATAATVSATVKMGLDSATSIGGTAFTGTYPIVGNAYSIIAGGSLGTINAGPLALSASSQRAGTLGVTLGRFLVTAGISENINVNQIIFNNLGTAFDGDITNIKVKVDGVEQGTAAGFVSKKATVNFTTPVAIAKGLSKTVEVTGDVVLGIGRTSQLNLAIGSISAVGVTSGVGLSGPAAAQACTGVISIIKGNLVVSTASSPAGTAAQYVKSTSPQTLGIFDVKAQGEDVLVSSIKLSLVLPATGGLVGEITSVDLYDEAGSMLTGNLEAFGTVAGTLTTSATTNAVTFNVNYTIPANTTKKFYVKGITNGVTTGGKVQVNLVGSATAVGTASIVGTGLTSSGQEGQGSDNVWSNSAANTQPVTIGLAPTSAVAGSIEQSYLNQAVLGGLNKVLLGTIKVTASKENQDLDSLALLATVTGGETLDQLVSSVTIYDGADAITESVAPSGDTVTFGTTDITDGATFVVSTPKVLSIYGATINNATYDGDTIYFSVPTDGLVTVGVTSQETFSLAATTSLRSNFGLATEAGTYTLNSIVVEATNDVATIASGRASDKTYMIVDLKAYGTDSATSVTAITFHLPSGLPAGATTSMFKLTDVNTGTDIVASTTITLGTTNTVAFTNITGVTVNPVDQTGSVTKVALKINTLDRAVWPASSTMQWRIATQGSLTATGSGFGTGDGVTFSVPVTGNLIELGVQLNFSRIFL